MILEQRESGSTILVELTMAVLAVLLVIIMLAGQEPGLAAPAPSPTATPLPPSLTGLASTGAAPAAQPRVSPAAALGSGRPSLFYFYPADMCAIRYCLQPEDIAAGLVSRFGEQ